MKKTLATLVAASLTLAACTTPTMPYLKAARDACTKGNQDQCAAVPNLQAQVNLEKDQQAREVSNGILAGLAGAAAGASAVAAARQPVYYQPTVVVVCPRWRPYC